MVSWALPEGDGDKLQSTGRTQRHWSPPGEDRVCRDMVGTTGLSRTVRAEGADMVGVPDGGSYGQAHSSSVSAREEAF